jgi:hypothetical protein
MRVGDRVRMIHSDDPSGIPPGLEGTIVAISAVNKADVRAVPDAASLLGRKKVWVEWETGGRTAVIEGCDRFEVIPQPKKGRGGGTRK